MVCPRVYTLPHTRAARYNNYSQIRSLLPTESNILPRGTHLLIGVLIVAYSLAVLTVQLTSTHRNSTYTRLILSSFNLLVFIAILLLAIYSRILYVIYRERPLPVAFLLYYSLLVFIAGFILLICHVSMMATARYPTRFDQMYLTLLIFLVIFLLAQSLTYFYFYRGSARFEFACFVPWTFPLELPSNILESPRRLHLILPRPSEMDVLVDVSGQMLLEATKHMDFDHALGEVGDFGVYQILFFFIICLPASLPSAFSAFNQPFVVGSPSHQCRVPPGREDLIPDDADIKGCFQYNQTQVDFYRQFTTAPMETFKKSIELVPCQHGWEYDNSTYLDSLVTEFNLVCEKQGWVEISTTSFYVGSFIGNFLFGYIADKFGRRRSFFLILTVLVVCGTINAFVKDIESFIIMRFLTGLPFPALFQIPFIICMEFMGKSGRIFSGLMISLFFGAAMALLGIVAMFIRRWRQLTFFCNAPFVVMFSYYFFLPESPRWLVSVGRWGEAKKQLQRIAKLNGKTEVDVDQLVTVLKNNHEAAIEEDKKHSHNVTDLFKTPNLRKKTIIVTYIWVMNAVIYNGLTLNVSNLPVNDYWSFTINGAVELPAYLMVWPLLQLLGRRWTLALTMLVCGIGCVSAMFMPEDYPWLVASASFIGKFGVGSGFAVIYIFAGELYPTVVRAIGMGMSSMVAGSGLLLAPHIVKLGDYWRILPMIVMGLMALSAGILTFFLPETLGAPLPMTIDDAENFGKKTTKGLFTAQLTAVQTKKRESQPLLAIPRKSQT